MIAWGQIRPGAIGNGKEESWPARERAGILRGRQPPCPANHFV